MLQIEFLRSRDHLTGRLPLGGLPPGAPALLLGCHSSQRSESALSLLSVSNLGKSSDPTGGKMQGREVAQSPPPASGCLQPAGRRPARRRLGCRVTAVHSARAARAPRRAAAAPAAQPREGAGRLGKSTG